MIDELTRRPEFRLGAASVHPASREVCGPTGVASVEPRIMQVLVTLADARGTVVSRAELMRRCWGGQIVGDDALNRAISEIRRLARTVGGESFTVETISKAGYRLIGEVLTPADKHAEPDAAIAGGTSSIVPSRRALLLTGLGFAATAATLYDRLVPAGAPSKQVADLVARGDAALHADLPDSNQQGIQYFQQAARLSPDDAGILGRLALAWCAAAEFAPPEQRATFVSACEAAARQALALDGRSADAQAALALLQPEFGDWLVAEHRLRAVLAIDPRNEAALGGLAVLLQGVGRTREAGKISDALFARYPLAPRYTYWRSYSLWTLGHLEQADRLIDRGMELWPQQPGVWFARLWLFALTDRAPAAARMLGGHRAAPLDLTDAHRAVIEPSLTALTTNTAADRKRAVQANLAAAMAGPSWAVYATMILSKLAELDAAFDVARGYLLRAGDHVGSLEHSAVQPSVNDQRHRKTMMLFVPPTSALRADPRFEPLCEAMGMADYWRQAGRPPDP